MNYQKAADVQKLLSDPTQRILSKRGSAVVDARTNTLFVQDTPSRLEEVRRLIAKIDVAGAPGDDRGAHRRGERQLQQNLGARLGCNDRQAPPATASLGQNSPRFLVGGGLATPSGFMTGGRSQAGTPTFIRRHDQRQPAGGRPEQLQRRAVLVHPVQQRGDALPQPGDLGAGGRRQGQDHLQPARADRRPGRGADRAGHGDPVPAGDLLGRDRVSFRKANLSLKVKPQITPDGNVIMTLDVNKDAARRDHAGRRADQHQARQDRGAGRERRHGGDRRHLRAERPHRHHPGAVLRRPARTSASCSRTRRPRPAKTELLVFITPRIVNERLTVR